MLKHTYRDEIEYMRTCTMPIVLCGAGSTCDFNLRYFRNLGIYPAAFADNSQHRQGAFVDDLPILSFEKIKEQFPGAYYYITTQMYYSIIHEQLVNGGVSEDYISRFDIVCQLQWEEGCSSWYADNKAAIEKINELLSDKLSKKVLRNRLEFLKTRDRHLMSAIRSEKQYFDSDLIDFTKVQTFVDCGMYTGDTIEDYIKVTGGNYKHIYGFEPDKAILENAKQNLSKYADIDFICKGTSDKNETVKVSSGLGVMQSIENGIFDPAKINKSFEICTLDDWSHPYNENIDLIKMDIEGAELDSLHGAKKLIQNKLPALAVCVYHKIDDIIKIPQYIYELCGDRYAFYFRHYSDNQTETVCYMIPDKYRKKTIDL